MELLITILGAILAIFFVILIHESGHFMMAKMLKVGVLRFSIGFGKPLWKYQSKAGTEYVLALLPLGGYVKMLDEREGNVDPVDIPKSFNRQSLVKRMAIVIAGPLMNFILAMVCFWLIYLLGVTTVKPVIGQIIPDSVAEKSGLKAGDELITVSGRPTNDWESVLSHLINQIGSHLKTTVIVLNPQSEKETYSLDLNNWKLDGKDQDPLRDIGIIPFQPKFPALIAKVLPNSPAEHADLLAKDQIVGLDNKEMKDWPSLSQEIKNRPNQEIILNLNHEGREFQKKVYLGAQQEGGKKVGYLGVAVQQPEWPKNMLHKQNYNALTAWIPAYQQTADLIGFNFIVLVKMVTGKIGLSTLGGPISIFKTAGEASQAGFKIYVSFIAFISVTLGFINILPIPALDGGHLLFQVVEGIIRRPIPDNYQNLLLRMGIILIILLILQGTINDLVRLF